MSDSLESKTEFPKSPEDQRRARNGKLTGEGGLVLFGGKKDSSESGDGSVSGIGINSYLWRATLDTLSFMPLASADPFGGVIITDWYEDAKVRGERFKVNAVILGSELRSNAVKVSVFKQTYNKATGWRDQEPGEQLASELEDKILTKARQLRIAKEAVK